jgi:hypothetical protein
MSRRYRKSHNLETFRPNQGAGEEEEIVFLFFSMLERINSEMTRLVSYGLSTSLLGVLTRDVFFLTTHESIRANRLWLQLSERARSVRVK